MRLYRFINTDKKIDVVVVTDGSCEQKRVFITESPRGVVPAGSVNPSADEKAGKVNGRTPMEFTLADLGLDAKEDLNLVVMADAGVQKFEVVAKNSK